MTSVDRILGEAMTPYQQGIVNNSEKAYQWAKDHQQRFPEAETTIAKNPQWAYYYAKDVIKSRWPEAEAAIVKDPSWALNYARYVIKGRWPKSEEEMVKRPYVAYIYAKYILKNRWSDAEAAIAKSMFKSDYLETFPEAKEDWALNGWVDWMDT